MVATQRRIRSELYLNGRSAEAYFYLLHEQKEAIDDECVYELDWQELPHAHASRIAISLDSVDPWDKNDWPRQHEWLATCLNELHRVFGNRVRALDADDWRPADVETDPSEG